MVISGIRGLVLGSYSFINGRILDCIGWNLCIREVFVYVSVVVVGILLSVWHIYKSRA